MQNGDLAEPVPKHLPQVAPNSTVTVMLERARGKLLDSGTRNRLIHINRANTRAKAINIVNERTTDVFRILAQDGKTMQFQATGKDKVPQGEVDDGPKIAPLPAVGEEGFDEARFTDLFLETRLGPEAQQRKLLSIFRDARTAVEEQGVDILFLALGFLRWTEAKTSKIEREAPLILLPVRLIRNARTAGYDVQARDDDLVTNLSLQKRLMEDFGIELPEIDPEDFDTDRYFNAVAEAVSAKSSWKIDRDGMQLGFFSFAKLLMLRDLDPDTWPDERVGTDGPLESILTRRYEPSEPALPHDMPLDDALAPADMMHVVEADASQTRVIEEVRQGRNLVVQGPPGTGKSQTITNIIAAAVQDGRTVLFVAEKMAALSVVHDRLVKHGLRDVCLELHSRSANKRAVLQELKRTLTEGRAISIVEDPTEELSAVRDELNGWTSSLHKPVAPSGFTPYQLLGRLAAYMGRGMRPPPQMDNLHNLKKDEVDALERELDTLSFLLAERVDPSDHSFRGARDVDISTVDQARMEEEAMTATAAVRAVIEPISTLSERIGYQGTLSLDGAARLADATDRLTAAPSGVIETASDMLADPPSIALLSQIDIGVRMQAARAELSEELDPLAETVPLTHLRVPLRKGVRSFFARLLPGYRAARAEFRSVLQRPGTRDAAQLAELLDRTLALRADIDRIEADAHSLRERLGYRWAGRDTDFKIIQAAAHLAADLMESECRPSNAILQSLDKDRSGLSREARDLRELTGAAREVLKQLGSRLSLDWSAYGLEGVESAPLPSVESVTAAMQADPDAYVDWAQLFRARRAAEQYGLRPLIDRVFGGETSATTMIDQFRYAHAEAAWSAAQSDNAALKTLLGVSRHEAVNRFDQLEREWQKIAQHRIRATHLSQLPTGTAGEMALLRGEMAKKTRHMPLRRLMEKAGGMVQRIKPVLLMSPISVAQYLPPGRLEFDLLLIDEASQVRPEDALGAVARARQIVVVGDQKQLPPTSFFDRITENDEYDEDDNVDGIADATSMESILTLCEASGLRQNMLEWHYRSRDPSLITVSNYEFYDGGLRLLPSPLQNDPDYGLSFTRVHGVYSSASRGGGRPGTNRIEAEAVVDAVVQHARTNPDLTLGIVAFSVRQRDMISEVLELRRREDNELNTFLIEGGEGDLFVKNIENVQGDERDVIFVSVGYGPHEPNATLASKRFGPVNSKGGGRRLNVLFSRARSRCRVFCSFDPGDIVVKQNTPDGVRIFKRFLTYAKDGTLHESVPTGLGADSELEEDIAQVIRDLGYVVDPQVGTAGFRIDLGVRYPDRPGQYMLAVEADGATYHSALWARERDRLRQGVLEHLGWRFHRVWSTDWFQTRGREIERLKSALEAAARSENTSKLIAPQSKSEEEASPQSQETGDLLEEIPALAASLYVMHVPRQVRFGHPENYAFSRRTDLVAEIVDAEGPAHFMVVAKRMASAFDLQRTGRRIQAATRDALQGALDSTPPRLLREGEFYMTGSQQADPPIRDRSGADAVATAPEHLPPGELRKALNEVVTNNGIMEREETVREIARLLGFRRVSSKLSAAIGLVVDQN